MAEPLRVGVVGGTHPDEEFPVALVRSLSENSIPGVSGIIANERGVEYCEAGKPLQTRGVDLNMSHCFYRPLGEPARTYEEQRADEVLAWCDEGNFDVILEIHTNKSPGLDMSAVAYKQRGDPFRTTTKALVVAGLLQATKLIYSRERFNLFGARKNAITLDISHGSRLLDISEWRKELAWLVNEYNDSNPISIPEEIYWHEGGITQEDRHVLGLQRARPNFTRLPNSNRLAFCWGDGGPGELVSKGGNTTVTTAGWADRYAPHHQGPAQPTKPEQLGVYS